MKPEASATSLGSRGSVCVGGRGLESVFDEPCLSLGIRASGPILTTFVFKYGCWQSNHFKCKLSDQLLHKRTNHVLSDGFHLFFFSPLENF